MLLEHENTILPEPLFLDHKERYSLREEVLKAAFRFPGLFSRLLYRSFEQFVVNSPSDFLAVRTKFHLKEILCFQFFLQKKLEKALQENRSQKHFILKLFRGPSRICVCLAYSSSYNNMKPRVLNALDSQMPGISEVSRSFYTWQSPELPYTYTYFEVDKLRGKDLNMKELGMIEKIVISEITASPPLTPAVFWPYNKEESHRQIQLLVREMTHTKDIPHVSIHFQEQTAHSLEFLVHLVRPEAIKQVELEALPESLYFFRYSHHVIHTPFSIEIEAFSIKLDAQIFNVRNSINLLYARRYLVKQLEVIIGSFRDYNGGLLEKQQDHFEMVRLELSSKIPNFDHFAEKVFYALHPFERWLSLSMKDVEELFLLFSELIQNPNSLGALSTPSGLFTVVKTENKIDFLRIADRDQNLVAYAQLTIGHFHYECFSGEVAEEIRGLIQTQTIEDEKLKLIFQEGSPPSLNPHHSSSDMRCRLLSKMLFEGLTRLDETGDPMLAGAQSFTASNDHLTYTFYLRKAAWSNGEKVTAIDYADSWRWALEDNVCHPEKLYTIKNAKNFRLKKCGFNEVGIRVINPETIQVELNEPDPDFFHKLSQPYFFPLFGQMREPKWFNGPYLVQENRKRGLKLSKNPYFWKGKDSHFESVAVEYIDDNEESYALFKQGKIDWIGDPLTILTLDQIKDLENDKLLRKKKFFRRFSLLFNTKHYILSSVPIRQALNLAIDRSKICDEIYPYSEALIPEDYSKELALAYFEQGLKELGLTRATFPELVFNYSHQARRDELAAYLKSVWKNTLGIDVRLEKQKWNQFRSRLEKRKFEICPTIHDTLDEYSCEYLEGLEGPSSYNYSQWTHLVYRQIIEDAKKESDPFKQQELKARAVNILKENIPRAPLLNYVHLYAVHPRLECPFFDSEGCVDFSQGKYR